MLMLNQLVGFGVGQNWLTSASVSLNNDSTGWAGYTAISRFEPGAISFSGARLRIRYVPPSAGNNTVIANCYVGHAASSGDTYDFDGTQVRQTFGGANGKTLTAGGASEYGDDVIYSLDRSRAFLVVMDFVSTTDLRRITSAGANHIGYTKNATGETATTNKTGYTELAGYCFVSDRIEVYA